MVGLVVEAGMVRQSAWQLFGWDVQCAAACDQAGLSLASWLPWFPAPGTRLPPGQEVVGDVLLGCLLEKWEAAEFVGGVEQA